MHQCDKLTTYAVIMKNGKLISTGINERKHDFPCFRKKSPAQKNYHYCKDLCEQVGHAEEVACLNAGIYADGATLYLIGHTYICDNCMRIMKEHGIARAIICDTGEVVEL